jgi:hypothetical protein
MKEFELTLARLEDRIRQRGDTALEGELAASRAHCGSSCVTMHIESLASTRRDWIRQRD